MCRKKSSAQARKLTYLGVCLSEYLVDMMQGWLGAPGEEAVLIYVQRGT